MVKYVVDEQNELQHFDAFHEMYVLMANESEFEPDHIQFSKNYSMDNVMNKEMSLREYTNNIIKHFLLKYNDDVVMVSKKLKIGIHYGN
jgi:hypothetical protein